MPTRRRVGMNVIVPDSVFQRLHAHLFQDELEQEAFLFGRVTADELRVEDLYVVPSGGWDVQLEVYLEMKDSERGKIMQMAIERQCDLIDCHSHPGALDDVWFSPSDVAGITAFAQYAKWKLRGRAYVAMVWGESSVDAVAWSGDFGKPAPVGSINVEDIGACHLTPTGSWFREPRAYRRKIDPHA